jgi:hypothetical protein
MDSLDSAYRWMMPTSPSAVVVLNIIFNVSIGCSVRRVTRLHASDFERRSNLDVDDRDRPSVILDHGSSKTKTET